MITQGYVTTDETNIYCQGANFVNDNKQLSNMLEYQTVGLSMVELSIQIGKQEIQELWDMTILSLSCITKMKCIVSHLPYYQPTKQVRTQKNKNHKYADHKYQPRKSPY